MGMRLADGTWKDSGLDKVSPNEPIFVLRAQDKSASTLVRIWANMNSTSISNEKFNEARTVLMLWKNGLIGKTRISMRSTLMLLRWRTKRIMERAVTWIVWRLPRVIVYWSAIRLMTSVNPGHPDDIKASDYLKAWDKHAA